MCAAYLAQLAQPIECDSDNTLQQASHRLLEQFGSEWRAVQAAIDNYRAATAAHRDLAPEQTA